MHALRAPPHEGRARETRRYGQGGFGEGRGQTEVRRGQEPRQQGSAALRRRRRGCAGRGWQGCGRRGPQGEEPRAVLRDRQDLQVLRGPSQAGHRRVQDVRVRGPDWHRPRDLEVRRLRSHRVRRVQGPTGAQLRHEAPLRRAHRPGRLHRHPQEGAPHAGRPRGPRCLQGCRRRQEAGQGSRRQDHGRLGLHRG